MSALPYVNAGNDANGNPRRGWIEYDSAKPVRFYDEGYLGVRAVPEQLRERASGYMLAITPGEYRRLRRLPGGGGWA